MQPVRLVQRFKQAVLLGSTALIWLVLGMVYLDRFPWKFIYLKPKIMPWKGLKYTPVLESFDERLQFMQRLLDESVQVANISFVVLALSFVAFGFYLTYLYQQRKRRARENELLLIKNREIARRNEFIRYISATIGHEFKNNLGRIKRRIDLLDGIDPKARERLDGNLTKLFADIDIFKKISDEREAKLIDFMQVDLGQMLRSLAETYSDLVEFRFEGAELAPSIFASPLLLETVFENLIDNSIKYKKPGQERAQISISFSRDEDVLRHYLTIKVRDEGLGMDEPQADRSFYKGRQSGDGWGQGLYFVKYVVGLHAGKVRVGKEYTAPDRGVEMIINLPLVEEEFSV